MQVRPDLDAEIAKASLGKVPLRMANPTRLEMMDVLLEIQKIAGDAFDVLDCQEISEADVLRMLQLPDWCNKFTRAMEAHAQKRIRDAGLTMDDIRTRQRTSYMGTRKPNT